MARKMLELLNMGRGNDHAKDINSYRLSVLIERQTTTLGSGNIT
jgi:hypothetical protein